MSSLERDRLQLFGQVGSGFMTLKAASEHLGLSYRQAKRLWARYRDQGDAGLIHRLRGRPSNNQASADHRRACALALYAEHYRGFGPTLAAEQLRDRHGLQVDHETLRGWLIGSGLWKARRQPRRSHRRRERRPAFGEMVQIDGSDHAWFGSEHPRCVLMVMIDDATNQTLARFYEGETTAAAMDLFQRWVKRHGLPGSLYSDRDSIYRRNDPEAMEELHRTGKRPPTRFGEAMAELDVELICAHSPQAKGRVERANRTLQDRLVKLLSLEGITDMAAANAYLETAYLRRHNARFACRPGDAAGGDAHRPRPSAQVLSGVLCPEKDKRVVDSAGCVSWRGRCFELLGEDASPRRRQAVWVRERLDGRVELVAQGEAGRVLRSRERVCRPTPTPVEKPSLADRVKGHVGPSKPGQAHPWRGQRLSAVSAAARCARLRYDSRQPQTKGTLLLG